MMISNLAATPSNHLPIQVLWNTVCVLLEPLLLLPP